MPRTSTRQNINPAANAFTRWVVAGAMDDDSIRFFAFLVVPALFGILAAIVGGFALTISFLTASTATGAGIVVLVALGLLLVPVMTVIASNRNTCAGYAFRDVYSEYMELKDLKAADEVRVARVLVKEIHVLSSAGNEAEVKQRVALIKQLAATAKQARPAAAAASVSPQAAKDAESLIEHNRSVAQALRDLT